MGKSVNKKLMVFESAPDFSDNSRALWEYVVENSDFKTFWVIKDEKMYVLLKKLDIDCALEGSTLANEMISEARFLISSSFYFSYQKTSEQIHISVWHGFPLKLIGFFDSATSNANTFEMLKVITTQSDMIAVTSRLSQLTVSGMFSVDPRKVKETGYPRNDFLYKDNGRKELSKITDLDIEESKLILYLPTMRKGLKVEGEQFQDNVFNYPDFDADIIDEFLIKKNAYIFTKLHFADNEFYSKGNFKLPSRMIFLDSYMLNKNYLTIYHIMNAFNVLITDYSSVYVDFMLLNKPIIFSCPDLEKYKNDRGFIVDDPTLLMPGTIVKTQSMLLKTLDDIFEGEDYYKKERENNMKFFHKYKDGNSSRRLFTEILQTDKKGIEDSSKAMGRYFFDQSSPLSQYVKNIKTEVFFDTGNGFSEETKIVNIFKLKDEEDLITLELDIPDNVKAIRFDPDDVGRFILKCLSIKINNVKMKYKIVRGYEIDNCIYFYGFDPQITILLESKPYGKLKIEFICKDFYSSAGRIIEGFDARILDIETQLKETYKKLHDTNQQLSEIKASNSWKWTKPLRDIGRVVKGVVKK